MTLSTVLLINAILDVLVISGIVGLLAWGIRADDQRPRTIQQRVAAWRESERLAA